MQKLYDRHVKTTESQAPAAVTEQVEEAPPRKKNYFERKKFVEYEQNTDSQHDKSKEQLKNTDDNVEDEEVFVVNKREKQQAVKSKAPPAKKTQEKPASDFVVKEPEAVKPKEEPKEVKKDLIEDDYEDNWDMSDHDL